MANDADDAHTGEHCCGTCAYAHQIEAGAIALPPSAGALVDASRPLHVSIHRGAALRIHAQRTTFGRSASCDVTIDDPALSRTQFVLERTEGGWQITDNASACGTFVDGRPVRSALLREGAEIRVGNAILSVRGA